MQITKQAVKTNDCTRSWYDYPRARDAFEAFLRNLRLSSAKYIIVPNYIGYSVKEGSGVFDPIERSGVKYRFYELDSELRINMTSVARLLDDGHVGLVVLIHYFGYVDENYEDVIELARVKGVPVLEDQAHSLFTDLYGGNVGRLCDASIYSLHKMFPVENGGALSLTDGKTPSRGNYVARLCLEHDISSISKARIRNAEYLTKRLNNHTDVLHVLRPVIAAGIVPQTFPILILEKNRDKLYEEMNDAGFGVVSLYHTMIRQIEEKKEFFTNAISKKILNLPVHQDVDEKNLDAMCTYLLDNLYKKI